MILSLINYNYWFQFNTNSCLPKQVCFNCASTIIAFNDLWNISIKTNEEFNSLIFDVENKLNVCTYF